MAQIDHLIGIQAFIETARYMNFTQAAEALGVTKSAVGKSVSRLEHRLGTKLIHRSTRRLVLTADGEAYLNVARRAVEEITAAEQFLTSRNRHMSGRLRIDAPAAWGRKILLPILIEIKKAHPNLQFSLSFNDRIIDLVSERIDLAIRFGETPDTAGLMTRKLGQQRVPLVASPAYLIDKGTPQTLNDLHMHDCITGIERDVPVGYRIINNTGNIERLNITPTHEIGDGEAVIDAAIAGLGIAQMPLFLVEQPLLDGRLVEVLSTYGMAPVGLYALWPKTHHLLARVRHVIDVLVQQGQQNKL